MPAWLLASLLTGSHEISDRLKINGQPVQYAAHIYPNIFWESGFRAGTQTSGPMTVPEGTTLFLGMTTIPFRTV